jgi:Domain of unknown function (DUF4157)
MTRRDERFALALCLTLLAAPADAVNAQLLGKLDPVKIVTGRSIEEQFDRRVRRLGRAVEKFADDPLDYIASRPQSLANDICAAIPRTYEGALRGQVSQWHGLTARMIQVLQPHYPNVNLGAVRYAFNAPTANGQAQTFGNTIYFPTVPDWHDWDDLRWLLHELEHVVQYKESSVGQSGKLCEYVLKAAATGFDPSKHDWEMAANRKADHVIGLVYPILTSGDPTSTSPTSAARETTMFGHWGPDTYLYSNDPNGIAPPGNLYANQVVIVNQSSFYWNANISSPSFGGWIAMPPWSSRIVQTHRNESTFSFTVPNNVGPPAVYSLTGGRRYAIRCYPPPTNCQLEQW